MQEKEFDLLTEPWIRVSTRSLEQKEVSLMDGMLHAQEYVGLAGETPTQDAALLRVLLAAALTIFYRYDEDGNEDEISEENDSDEETVLERWKKYWERGAFPETAVREYFQRYSERFWLFHPETPFWQVNDLNIKSHGTQYEIKSLMGNIKESSNGDTRHHFSMKEGKELEYLKYAEAARWLIYFNAYGIGIKYNSKYNQDKKDFVKEDVSGSDVGRLAKLGFIFIGGDNLFKTMMLNMCPLKDGDHIWKKPNPIWEQNINKEQLRITAPPDNLPERYTIQSRRIQLKRDAIGNIIEFRAMRGDFYAFENDLHEPMTLWQKGKGAKKESVVYIPKTHNSVIHAWEEFPALMSLNSDGRIPGVIQWINLTRCAS